MSEDLLSARKFLEDEVFKMHEKIDNVAKECQTHRKKSNDGGASSSQGTSFSPLKVSKPDMYNGTRNATLVENFLFGLEQYFEAMGVDEDAARISNAPAFLRESVQLWWRRKHHEREKGICDLNTWDQFKIKLRKQFVPHNADSEAKAKLRRLRHTGTISDYIKEFTITLLEIVNVADQNALFYIKDGLKEWARVEIDRRNVKALDEAIATAESIVDYSNRPRRPLTNKTGVERAPVKRLDGGPKFERECPSRKAINALVVEIGPKIDEPSQGELRSIRRLSTLKEMLTGDESKEQGLLFMELMINDEKTLGLIDTGASHNFLDVKEAERMGITYNLEKGTIKTVNAKPEQIAGTAKVKVRIDKWTNELTFSVVPMDDYRVVLGLDFFERARAFPIPATKTLVILDNEVALTTSLKKRSEIQHLLSATGFKKETKEGECYLAAVREFLDDHYRHTKDK
ncbi:hypothetical protein CTI12_AA489850 [Artemisia annua]|uniref:Retrotransposon gag domain-containing protein n=1 Tax=Artemisia annua TaxID=35608 RepID=A0A2U1LHQ1_ARTAN|nr:hypothetical protein CTI12_AA489850 [Artemisia annua]